MWTSVIRSGGCVEKYQRPKETGITNGRHHYIHDVIFRKLVSCVLPGITNTFCLEFLILKCDNELFFFGPLIKTFL